MSTDKDNPAVFASGEGKILMRACAVDKAQGNGICLNGRGSLSLEDTTISGTGALVVVDRASTAAEQARFAAAAGDEYGEALASVNTALATWPSMRGQAEAAVKADYVAICLYLGRGRGGFDDLNTAVRGGAAGEIDGQVHCLASGLRRLPTHRRPVLRQGKDALGLERAIEPGSILTEPGFLVGSMDLDVTLAEADLDVLIWPASARRTSELLIGQPVNEVVFFAGARFKALALREAEVIGDEPEVELTAPRLAALFRELAPGEEVSAPGELDDQDLAVLAKLDRALERRRRGALRVIEERDLMNRMTKFSSGVARGGVGPGGPDVHAGFVTGSPEAVRPGTSFKER
ncbi:hypothetical protein SD37_10700 [Amycolatopsis orientalis]|uniref:Uncharacterized protein n=1 Tax=Amycolatopsis orientalis TaxID=31958 RepID=A0A193BV62_AMYOR|nr:hypothetical protein [Amycolatopsis orientalis]ANN16065.1 hypothetical protein SD37_10700 [Amycolatopsis orientalis]